eukprot:gb/GEZN01003058.1/.p1 GENE.gb/GEZN01003058.1/~~gb/GEZN01003058.1/.p1  ORF type:complete len:549 (-),score=45.68 gb/GEZN01003058.1/:546-2192(-)
MRCAAQERPRAKAVNMLMPVDTHLPTPELEVWEKASAEQGSLCNSPDIDPKFFIFNTNLGAVYAVEIKSVLSECVMKISSVRDRLGRRCQDPIRELEVFGYLEGITHPNILRCLKYGRTESHVELLVEMCSKGDLFEALADLFHRSTQPTGNLIRFWFHQMLSGVACLHQHGIAHLDLSPENFFLDRDGNLKIGDFGAAEYIEPTARDKQMKMAVRGKNRYMSPEISLGMKVDCFKCDSWSLGMILFFMLTGEFVFDKIPMGTMGLWFSQRVSEGKLVGLMKDWGFDVDSGAIDLLSHLFCPEEQRWTVAQALEHPWLDNHDFVTQIRLNPARILAHLKESHSLELEERFELAETEGMPLEREVTGSSSELSRANWSFESLNTCVDIDPIADAADGISSDDDVDATNGICSDDDDGTVVVHVERIPRNYNKQAFSFIEASSSRTKEVFEAPQIVRGAQDRVLPEASVTSVALLDRSVHVHSQEISPPLPTDLLHLDSKDTRDSSCKGCGVDSASAALESSPKAKRGKKALPRILLRAWSDPGVWLLCR